MTTHTCPAQGCRRTAQRDELACPTHWRALPHSMRVAISTAWSNGDEDAHQDALADALEWYMTHDCAPASVYTDYGTPTGGGE